MANWSGTILTDKGRALEAKVHAGRCKFEYTKMQLGDGASGARPNMTELASPRQVVPIAGVTFEGDHTEIRGEVNNKSVNQQYYMREIGLYAKDPDAGEILFMIMTDSQPDVMLDKNAPTIVSTSFTFVHTVAAAELVQLDIVPEGMARLEDITDAVKKHNEHDDAHKKKFEALKSAMDSHALAGVLDHPAGSVQAQHLASAAVTSSKLDSGAVTSSKLGTGAVTSDKLASGAVTSSKLGTGAVTSDKLANINSSSGSYAFVTYNRAGQVTSGTNTISATVNYSYSPTVPTPTESDNSTKAANTSFVQRAYKSLKSYVDDEIAKLKKYVDGKVQEVVGALDGRKIVAKLTSDILGVRASIGENGYINLGPLFFGLIIQWGRKELPRTVGDHTIPYNIAFPSKCCYIYAKMLSSYTMASATSRDIVVNKYNAVNFMAPSSDRMTSVIWFAIGC